MAEHTKIAVLESKWWNKSNVSARGLFDLVSDMHCETPHGYHYEMVNSEAAAKEAISRVAGYTYCKILCIATHGDENGLRLYGGGHLSRTELRNALKNGGRSTIDGLHLSSCTFGTHKIADYLFNEGVRLTWVAGYSNEVDWLESSALDLLFFNEMLSTQRKTNKPRVRIEKVAERIRKLAPGLARRLGFGVFVRERATGEVVDLLAEGKD